MPDTSTQPHSELTPLHDEVADLRANVERLENNSDKWKIVSVVMSAALALLLIAAIIVVFSPDDVDEISAESFHVVKDGKTVAVLDSVFDGGGRLRLFGQEGRYYWGHEVMNIMLLSGSDNLRVERPKSRSLCSPFSDRGSMM